MDPHERSLTRAYNKAVARLNGIPRGHPSHLRAVVQATRALYVLRRYQRAKLN